MIEYIAILFILYVTFFIGWRVAKPVPDETEYIQAFLKKKFKQYLLVYAVISGVVIGLLQFLAIPAQTAVLLLLLILNFFLGAWTKEQKKLAVGGIIQPVVALAILLFILLLRASQI